MNTDRQVSFDDLVGHPACLRVLLALLDVDQAYSFRLTRITGHHSRMLRTALDLLLQARLIRTVVPKTHIRNVGDFYSLTPHGRVIALGLKEIREMLEKPRLER